MRRIVGRASAVAPAVVLGALLAAGCGAGAPAGDRPATGREPTAPPDPERPPGDVPPSTTSTNEEDPMRIRITIGGLTAGATLQDSAATRDLAAQLPLTLEMREHGGVEKTGRLPAPLSLEGQPDGADPEVGDVGYYSPGDDLVLYHGDQSFFPGIVLLGRLDGGAAERIARLDGSVVATVEAW